MLACGYEKDFSTEESDKSSHTIPFQPQVKTTAPTENGLTELLTIPVSFGGNSLQGLSLLANATAYTISLEDCASGYTSTATIANPQLNVYKDDEDCVAKLTSFTYSSTVYGPSSGDPFSTWQTGDTAVFELSGTPADNYTVEVVAALSSPVSAADTVEYEFRESAAGSGESLFATSVGFSETLVDGGQDPPSYSVAITDLAGQTAGNGLQYVITLECTSAVSGSSCESVDMSLIRYRLVADSYSSDLDLADAQALFPSGESSINIGTENLATGSRRDYERRVFHKTLDTPNNVETNAILF